MQAYMHARTPCARMRAPLLRSQARTDTPHGVPALWVVVRHAEAQLCVDSKAAVGCEQADAGRLKWVLGWEHQLAMVHPSGKVGSLGAFQHEVPLQEVVAGVRRDVRHGLLRRFGARAVRVGRVERVRILKRAGSRQAANAAPSARGGDGHEARAARRRRRRSRRARKRLARAARAAGLLLGQPRPDS
eukprot:363031-Chlamydomonas_euryale.AAC.7